MRCARGLGQDHHPRGEDRLVDRQRGPARVDRRHHLQQARAEELAERLDAAIAPLGVAVGTVRVRTFHALGREILSDAGLPVEPLLDRAALVAELWPDTTAPDLGRLDTAFSRLKLDLGVSAAEIAADPEAGPLAQAFVAYEAAIAARGLDFDDLVRGGLDALERDPNSLARWRERCGHLLVDEVQDVDRSQLRLALLLAAPGGWIFLVGDDDQSIYGWRLADASPRAGPGCEPPGPATRRPRGEPPLPRPGGRARRPPHRAQPRAVCQGRPATT